MTTTYTDLSGVFSIQQSLLNDIKDKLKKTTDINERGELYNQITQIEGSLDNYNKAFQDANKSSAQIVERQNNVMNILDTEYNRLTSKQQNIDNALEGKQRGSFLNDNYRERYSHYTKIVLTFVLTLVSIYILNASKGFLPIPDFVVNFIIVVIVGVALLLTYYNYMTIMVRDKIYFDELNLAPPDLKNNMVYGNIPQVDLSRNSLFSLPNFGLCVDSDCCSTGTVWDSNSASCVVIGSDTSKPSTTSAGVPTVNWNRALMSEGGTAVGENFTNLDLAYLNVDLKNVIQKGNTKMGVNAPNEFLEYTVYN